MPIFVYVGELASMMFMDEDYPDHQTETRHQTDGHLCKSGRSGRFHKFMIE